MSILKPLLLASVLATTAWSSSASRASQETPYYRDYFYIGGSYVPDGKGEHIYSNQMYVEKLLPTTRPSTTLPPIVMIHGQAQTGTNFLNKPDGGTGWASQYLSAGHTVYIVDQTFRGRSAWAPGAGADSPSTYSAELIQERFTAVQDYNLWPQARLHTQWPDAGVMGSPVFDAFYSSNVQFIANETYQQSTVQVAGAVLLDRIGEPVILFGHSQGTLMPLLIADARPKLTKAIILIEPTGPPFENAVFSTTAARPYGLTDIPITYSPAIRSPSELKRQRYEPPVANTDNSTVPCVLQAESPAPRKLKNLMDLPVLVVTGEASYHAPYDYCTVRYLKQAGVSKTEHVELSKEGIKGNGHMMFMEKNSEVIWKRVQKWVKSVV
jgi:pimeloyl-ACP methyl ester carboxylesterase